MLLFSLYCVCVYVCVCWYMCLHICVQLYLPLYVYVEVRVQFQVSFFATLLPHFLRQDLSLIPSFLFPLNQLASGHTELPALATLV